MRSETTAIDPAMRVGTANSSWHTSICCDLRWNGYERGRTDMRERLRFTILGPMRMDIGAHP
jgi:hypothetical protein